MREEEERAVDLPDASGGQKWGGYLLQLTGLLLFLGAGGGLALYSVFFSLEAEIISGFDRGELVRWVLLAVVPGWLLMAIGSLMAHCGCLLGRRVDWTDWKRMVIRSVGRDASFVLAAVWCFEALQTGALGGESTASTLLGGFGAFAGGIALGCFFWERRLRPGR